MGLLKPSRRLAVGPGGLRQLLQHCEKGGIRPDPFEPLARYRLQNYPGVMSEFPKFGIQLLPELVGGVIPGPAHIQSQLGQSIIVRCLRRTARIPRVAHDELPRNGGRAANHPLAATTLIPPIGCPLPGARVTIFSIFFSDPWTKQNHRGLAATAPCSTSCSTLSVSLSNTTHSWPPIRPQYSIGPIVNEENGRRTGESTWFPTPVKIGQPLYRLISTSDRGCEQQISTLPSAGGSSGSGR